MTCVPIYMEYKYKNSQPACITPNSQQQRYITFMAHETPSRKSVQAARSLPRDSRNSRWRVGRGILENLFRRGMTSPAPEHETSQHGFFREKQLRFYRQHGNQTLRYTVSSSSKGTFEGILSHSGLACCVACPSKLRSEFFWNNSWPNHYQSNQRKISASESR